MTLQRVKTKKHIPKKQHVRQLQDSVNFHWYSLCLHQ